MESEELRDLDRTAERAEMAPWTDFPPTPAWYPPAVGLWVAAMTAALAELPGLVGFVVVVVLAAVEGAFVAWCRRYRGTVPTGMPPAEMRTAMAAFVVGLLVLVAVLVVLSHLVATWVPVVVAFVAVTAMTWRYERAYAAGAQAARGRLR